MALNASERNGKMTWPGKSNCVQEKRDQNSFAKNLARPEPLPNVNGGMNKYGKHVSFQWNHPLPGSTSVSLTAPSSTSTTMVSATAPPTMDRPRSVNVSQPPQKQNRKTVEVHMKELGIPTVDKVPSKVERTSSDLQQLLSTLEKSPRPSPRPSGKDRPTTTTPSLPKTIQQHKVSSEPLRITPQEPSSSRQKITNPQQVSRVETTNTQTDRRPRETKQDGPGSRVTLVQITMPKGNNHMPPSNVKTSQTITPTTTAVGPPSKMLMSRDTSSTQQCVPTPRPKANPRGRPPLLQRPAPPENISARNDSQRAAAANAKPPKQVTQVTQRTPMPMITAQQSQATHNIERRQISSNTPTKKHNVSSGEQNAMNSRQENFVTKEMSMRPKTPNPEERQRNSSLQPMITNEMRPTTTNHTPPQYCQPQKNGTLDSQYPYEREPAQVNNWSTSSAESRSPSPHPQQLRSVPPWQRRRIEYVRKRPAISPAVDRPQWPALQMSPAPYREDRRRIMNAQAQEEWKWGMSSRCFGQRSLSLVTQGVLVPVRPSNYVNDDADRSTESLGSTVALMSMEREMKSVPGVDDTCPWEDGAAARGEADRCMQYTELAERALAKTTGRRGRAMMRSGMQRFTARERLLRRKEAEVERRRRELLAREQDLDALADNLDERYHNIARCHKAFHRALQHSCFAIENEGNELKTKFLRKNRLGFRRIETNDGGEAAARTLHLILRYADERMLERFRVGIAYALAFYACEYDLPHLLREIYQKLDVSTDLRDKRGFTLLHAAASRGAVRAAKVLLFEMGANICETTTSGAARDGGGDGGVKLTAMDLAQAGGHENMVHFLEDVNDNMEMVERGDGREDDVDATYGTVGGGSYADCFECCDGKWQRDNARPPSHRRLHSLSNFFHSGPGPAKRFKGAWYPFVAESNAWGDDYEYL